MKPAAIPAAVTAGGSSSATYTDTGLSAATRYTYRVQMRDAIQQYRLLSTSVNVATQCAAVCNLALTSTVSTSYVSPWETLGAVNDGYTPQVSSDYTHGAMATGTVKRIIIPGIGLNMTLARLQVNSTDVYWWMMAEALISLRVRILNIGMAAAGSMREILELH